MKQKMPKIFRLAKSASKYSDHRQHKLGCVIMSSGKPISVGFNSQKTHPMMAKYHPFKTLHAEAAALVPLKFKKIKNGLAVIYREDRFGNPAMSRPCSVCRQILISFGITECLYTIKGGWATETLVL